jgi:hypothetical protein
MAIEPIVLRLGLAGFPADQQTLINDFLAHAGSAGLGWRLDIFPDADAWWVNGSRTQPLPDGTVRIASGLPAGRSLQLNLPEIDRPVAFSVPLAHNNFRPVHQFDIHSAPSMHQVLGHFQGWLRPVAAQFCLASHIIEHESVLGSGIYHVRANDVLLAVVNLQGEVGVLPTAGPTDFEDAMWVAQPAGAKSIPEAFVRTSLSQLMWQYALRTTRDVLPKRYRTRLLYFRRAPRLPQRLLRDSHLLVLRDLAGQPCTFDQLQQHTGLEAAQLARDVAALYLVGAVTSNPKRRLGGAARRASTGDSTNGGLHSRAPVMDSRPGAIAARSRAGLSDLTAPAPMSLE